MRYCTAAGMVLAALLAGCASPGPPLAPSLKLPEVVTTLTASRVGDEVHLAWTTPAKQTDKLAIVKPVTAEICRDPLASTSTTPGATPNCTVVLQLTVKPGESSAVDVLPPPLRAGPPGLLAYRVRLKNAAGKSAGPSSPVFAASGAAPQAISGLRVRAAKRGAVLEWTPESAGGDAVELDRLTVNAPAASLRPAAEKTNPLTAPAREPVEMKAVVSPQPAGDPGGTLDATALTGRIYRYTAQRVRTMTLSGQTLQIRSAASTPVEVAMLDVFAPDAPAGLVAVAGFAGDSTSPSPAIDLSWEPVAEARVAGYRVYRRAGDSPWTLLNAALVVLPSYRDLTVAARQQYAYRVTAVDGTGNESTPSAEAVETAAGQ